MPVRRTIQSSSTPIRAPTSALPTTRSGRWAPRPTIRAVRTEAGRLPFALGADAGAAASGTDARLRRGLDDDALDDPLAHAGEQLARPDLVEALGARGVEGEERLAPADGPDERLRELLADVLEGPRGRAGEDGEARGAERDVLEGGAERRDGRGHRRGVEGARHGDGDGAGGAAGGGPGGGGGGAPARGGGRAGRPRPPAMRSASASRSRSPASTIWPGALSFATVTPASAAIARASSSSTPTSASMEP